MKPSVDMLAEDLENIKGVVVHRAEHRSDRHDERDFVDITLEPIFSSSTELLDLIKKSGFEIVTIRPSFEVKTVVQLKR